MLCQVDHVFFSTSGIKESEGDEVVGDGEGEFRRAGDGDFGRQLAGLPAAGPKDVVETVGGGDHVALDQLGDGLFVDDHFVVGDQVVGFRPTRRRAGRHRRVRK